VANSETTRRRIQEFWHRDANVVHPPVAVERFAIGEPEDFFLVVGELVRHKRVELAVRAAERAGLPIKVVGTGPDLPRLEARYGGRAEFLGRVDDAELARLYGRARAVVVPTCEEFGITAVEAQAAGRPVVAAGGGGQLETVVDGETGVFFAPDDGDALAEALRHTDFDRFSPARIKAHAQRFSTERFQHGLRREVATAVAVAC
jgi:glycosyltransferase involved in cell wall biosynthesis